MGFAVLDVFNREGYVVTTYRDCPKKNFNRKSNLTFLLLVRFQNPLETRRGVSSPISGSVETAQRLFLLSLYRKNLKNYSPKSGDRRKVDCESSVTVDNVIASNTHFPEDSSNLDSNQCSEIFLSAGCSCYSHMQFSVLPVSSVNCAHESPGTRNYYGQFRDGPKRRS